MPDIVITCVSESNEFGKEVYDYLFAELEKHQQLDEGSDLKVSRDLITLEDNEIHVSAKTFAPNGVIKWILQSLLKSDTTRFKDYDVIEIGELFTIGRVLHPSQMEMLTCEICGFFTPYSEELQTHRMTHFGI
jgi:hypothetical protein